MAYLLVGLTVLVNNGCVGELAQAGPRRVKFRVEGDRESVERLWLAPHFVKVSAREDHLP
jgi:hypothetical protein